MSAVVTVIAEQLSERLGHIISEERIAVISAHIAEPIRRAAIASLREPSEAQIQAMQRALTGWPRREAVIGQWQAAIDVILEDK